MGQRTGEALSNLGGTLLGVGANIYNKAEETKSSIRKYLIGSQIPQEVNRIYEQAAKNPDSKAGLEEFQNSFVGFAKGFMKSVPEGEDQLYAGRLLAHTAQTKEAHFNAEIKQQNKHLATFHLTEAVDKYQELALAGAREGDLNAANAHRATVTKLMFDGVKKGFIGASSAHLIQKQLNDSITVEHYSGIIGKATEAGDIKLLEAIKQDVINDKKMNHSAKTSLLACFSNIQGKNQLLNGIGEESFKEFKDEAVFQAQTKGIKLNANGIHYLASIKPKKAMEVRHAIDDGVEIYNAVKNQKLLPIDKKADYLQQLDERFAKASSAREQAIYKKAKDVVENEITLLKNDPIKFINSSEDITSTIEKELNTFQNTPSFQTLGETAKQEALKQRRATLTIQLQKSLGIEPRLLSEEKAQAMVAELHAAGFGNSLAHLQRELTTYGSHAAIVLKDLERAKLPIGLKYTLGASSDYQALLAKAFNTSSKELKMLAAIGEDGDYKNQKIVSIIQKKIHDYVNTLPASETLELEQAVYTGALQELADGRHEKTAVNNAARGIYEYKYQMIDNGYRIPKKDQNKNPIKSGLVHNKIRHLSAKIPDVLDSLVFPGSQALKPEQKAMLILDGKWRTMANDKGMFYVTSNERPVKTKNGFAYAFYFSDLAKDKEAAAQGIKDKVLNIFK
ncbi:hypothetical protein GAMM_260011 [Gammaproteobacteria bacterium]